MKKFLRIIWGIFAVIGILFVACFIGLRQEYGNFGITIHPGYEVSFDKFVDSLRSSGPFAKDTVSYYQEDGENRLQEAGRDIYLVPSGFGGFNFGVFKNDGEIVTTDAYTFWAAPVKAVLSIRIGLSPIPARRIHPLRPDPFTV